ncbi:MAG: hypothetical protein WBE13_02675 [Candidatus Acidiferrum sp.]
MATILPVHLRKSNDRVPLPGVARLGGGWPAFLAVHHPAFAKLID